jgi:prepilin-type N-terminal cleavage/methylation domain-containing protein
MNIQYKKTLSHNLKGFTLLELLVVISVIAVLAMVGLPNYIRTQRLQTLNSANLTFETGLTSLRNLALSGLEISNEIPDGYCQRYIAATGTLESFSYIDVDGDGKYSGTPDDTKKHVLTNDPIELPDLSPTGQFKGIYVSKILIKLRGADYVDEIAKEPIICFLPPKAEIKVLYAADGYTTIGPSELVYELSTDAAEGEVYNIIVDSVTGTIRASNGLTTSREPTS